MKEGKKKKKGGKKEKEKQNAQETDKRIIKRSDARKESKGATAENGSLLKRRKSPYSFRETVITGGLREDEDSRCSRGRKTPGYLVRNETKGKWEIGDGEKERERERKSGSWKKQGKKIIYYKLCVPSLAVVKLENLTLQNWSLEQSVKWEARRVTPVGHPTYVASNQDKEKEVNERPSHNYAPKLQKGCF
ncbi:hypothetical protein E2320_013106 [Naja naja]|nr:hypothetical protein E2320_013106 [Naja naja]